MGRPVRIFYSYSHKDEQLLEELKEALSPLKRGGLIQEWYDRMIPAGQEWEDAIDQNLETADLIILLVSASFISSDYCYGREMRRALEKHAAGEAQVVPVIARECEWSITPLTKLNALPKDGKAVSNWSQRDSAWANVAAGIRKAIDASPPRRAPTAAPLQEFYHRLCSEGQEALRDQTVSISPYLDDLSRDRRLGLTLIVRPSPAVANSLLTVNDSLKRLYPRQFYYGRERFHFTILSLITASDPIRVPTESLALYKQTIEDVLSGFACFDVEFSGVCATHNSLVAKGYPLDDTLEQLRDALRNRLFAVGLGEGLDDRYRIQGAHITMGRFTEIEDFTLLRQELTKLNAAPLGRMYVKHAQLVKNDWYMSPGKAELVAELPLQAGQMSPTEPTTSEVPGLTRVSVIHNLRMKPAGIVGRDAEHRHILRLLHESSKPVILTAGFGGIGKSTIAKIVAWTCVEQQEPFDFIVWIDVRGYGAIPSDTAKVISLNFILDEIARVADSSTDIPAMSNLDAKQSRVRELLKSRHSLLVLDNYEDLLSDPKEETRVSAFLESLPIGSVGVDASAYIRVLITTREVSRNLRALPTEDIRLQQLSFADSVKLMKARIPERVGLTEDQYHHIWEILCGLPKYMQIAADLLCSVTFDHWKKMVADIELPLDESEKFFRDIFEHSWERFPDQFQQILVSVTFFVGEASSEALQITSGVPERRFATLLASASDAYIESTGSGYTVHPLTYAFCRAMLNSTAWSTFRQQSEQRFVEYYASLTDAAHKRNQSDTLERELRNIVAASRLAARRQAWEYLISFYENMTVFLRIRGYWQEQVEITRLTVEACRHLGETRLLARCLVDDLGWLFLRFEDLGTAEEYIKEGLELFEILRDQQGIAQAKRHLGKSALLKGLDPFYEPDESNWGPNCANAERYYQESLDIRKALLQDGSDQRERIGDMHLDFGRLRWLQGRKLERDGRMRQDNDLIKAALDAYARAVDESRKARDLFEQLHSNRGTAKAWGNLGNAMKETARWMLHHGDLSSAAQCLSEAHEDYEKSLQTAEEIKRQDEIAHALWGLAEVHELYSDHPELYKGIDCTDDLLRKALDLAKESHRIYASLGGPRDIRATERLVGRIAGKLPVP